LRRKVVSLYWAVEHPVTKEELQFKTGYESWDDYSFKVGDDVRPKIDPEEPLSGRLLDDAYLASSYVDRVEKLYWVVIKGGKVHAVDDVELGDDGAIKGGERAQAAPSGPGRALTPDPAACRPSPTGRPVQRRLPTRSGRERRLAARAPAEDALQLDAQPGGPLAAQPIDQSLG
jgi:hypothetical protein